LIRQSVWAALALAVLPTSGCLPDDSAEQTQFAKGAAAAAVSAAPEPAKAKVISIQIRFTTACGWIDTGTEDGVMPFTVMGVEGRPGQIEAHGYVPQIAGQSLRGRIDGAFQRQLDLVGCEGLMPNKPAGVNEDSRIDGPLRRLWGQPKERWAIIPAMGDPGFVGVSRRMGGGNIQTPVYSSPEKLRAWIANEGNSQADAANAAGHAAMATSGTCIVKATAAGNGGVDQCPNNWNEDFSVLVDHSGP